MKEKFQSPVDVDGQSIIFKIDNYDTTLAAGSPDSANAGTTERVITIMLASEY